MEAYSSSPDQVQSPSPLRGDFAAGLRRDPDTVRVRGDFATGMRGIAAPLSRHTGDFAAGLRSRLHEAVAPGDFARGLRTADAEAGG